MGFVTDGEPTILPITHTVRGHSIVLRTGSGSKLEAAMTVQPIAFETDEWEPRTRRGWSVLARGVGETVNEDDELDELGSSGREPWLDSARSGTWVRIRVEEITGRRLGQRGEG